MRIPVADRHRPCVSSVNVLRLDDVVVPLNPSPSSAAAAFSPSSSQVLPGKADGEPTILLSIRSGGVVVWRTVPRVKGRRAGNLCCATGIKLDAGGGDIAPVNVGGTPVLFGRRMSSKYRFTSHRAPLLRDIAPPCNHREQISQDF